MGVATQIKFISRLFSTLSVYIKWNEWSNIKSQNINILFNVEL